jgi:hypothetical protein
MTAIVYKKVVVPLVFDAIKTTKMFVIISKVKNESPYYSLATYRAYFRNPDRMVAIRTPIVGPQEAFNKDQGFFAWSRIGKSN